ncbi:unnamed protein product [Mytilus coruscus]|uniref:Reverse transcriptase domain-containing protein n=1 Tax=Mytilus coruscus TaxID=42192 RepID=A0A6J8D8U7_MYTCO|nr:unnamed protein product [Mytilus coruscus]
MKSTLEYTDRKMFYKIVFTTILGIAIVRLYIWKFRESNNTDPKVVKEDLNIEIIIVSDLLDNEITFDEVHNIVMSSKNNKSPGVDLIQSELCKNFLVICTLTKLFNLWFKSCKIPNTWNKGIFNPIPKCSTSDPRDPLSYRGITLAPCAYKLYCSVLDNRLTE